MHPEKIFGETLEPQSPDQDRFEPQGATITSSVSTIKWSLIDLFLN